MLHLFHLDESGLKTAHVSPIKYQVLSKLTQQPKHNVQIREVMSHLVHQLALHCSKLAATKVRLQGGLVALYHVTNEAQYLPVRIGTVGEENVITLTVLLA